MLRRTQSLSKKSRNSELQQAIFAAHAVMALTIISLIFSTGSSAPVIPLVMVPALVMTLLVIAQGFRRAYVKVKK